MLSVRSKNNVPVRLISERWAHIIEEHCELAGLREDVLETISEHLISAVKNTPGKYLWSSYDTEADTLYINFKKPSHADDSELTEDDVIIRYEEGEVIGLTFLHASERNTS